MNNAITSDRTPGAGRWVTLAVLIALALAIGHFGLGRWTDRRDAADGGAGGARTGAAARDVRGVPPPPEARIEYSSSAANPRREVAAYISRMSAARVEAFYLENMPPRGWEPTGRSDLSEPEQAAAQLTFKDRTGTMCLVLISEQPEGSYVTVTVMELGAR